MLERLDGGELEVTVPNRRSFQAGIGGAQWAGLEPELRRLHLTPDALRRLLAKRGYELGEVKTPFTREARRLMWQTMVNAFTLRDNFHRNAEAGLIPKVTSKDRWTYRLDRLVTVLVAIPAGFFGYPLEALGRAARPRRRDRGDGERERTSPADEAIAGRAGPTRSPARVG